MLVRYEKLTKEYAKELLLQNVVKQPDGCWLFKGRLNKDGYGILKLGFYSYPEELAHRVSCFVFLDMDLSNPKNCALHKNVCPNKHCCSPEHLYVGSRKDNVKDSLDKGTHFNLGDLHRVKTHCPQGHEYTPENTGGIGKGLNGRYCKTCKRIKQKQNTERKKSGVYIIDANGNKVFVEDKYLQ